VTPDSFSDGGRYLDPGRAVEHAHRMVEEGADLIDVGGESTRPGAQPISVEEELRRVLPPVRRLAGELRVPLCVDTYKARLRPPRWRRGATLSTISAGSASIPGWHRSWPRRGRAWS